MQILFMIHAAVLHGLCNAQSYKCCLGDRLRKVRVQAPSGCQPRLGLALVHCRGVNSL